MSERQNDNALALAENEAVAQVAASLPVLPAGMTITPVGVDFGPNQPDLYDLVDLTCVALSEFDNAILRGQVLMWVIGDLISAGEAAYGDAYTDLIAASGYAYQTVANAAWVARAVPKENRRAELTWTHHEVVAALRDEPVRQRDWLAWAVDNQASTRDLSDAVQAEADTANGHDPAEARAARALKRAVTALEQVDDFERWYDLLADFLVNPLSEAGFQGLILRHRQD